MTETAAPIRVSKVQSPDQQHQGQNPNHAVRRGEVEHANKLN